MKGKLLIAVATVCLVTGPPLAFSRVQGAGEIDAYDYGFKVKGTSDDSSLTVKPGSVVTFAYPSGYDLHDVKWTGKKPTCTGVPDINQKYPDAFSPGWSGTCTFSEAGATYAFVCDFHPQQMTGKVVVEAAATPTPSSSATPTPTPSTPGATPTPTPTPGAGGGPGTPTQPAAQSKLTVKLASSQKGSRVRGSVGAEQAGAKLEVTVRRSGRRVGHWAKTATKAGTQTFSITVDAATRRTLRAKHKLTFSVAIALTPPGAKKLTKTVTVRLRG